MNRKIFDDPDSVPLPRPPAAEVTPQGFIFCPAACLPPLTPDQRSWQQWVYQHAFEQAQAVARPSLPERDLAGVWN
jgi:hypothetical protein